MDTAREEQAERQTLKDLLAEIRAEIGPATEEETQWAASVLAPDLGRHAL